MNLQMQLVSGAVVLVFALVHLFIGRLNRLDTTPRSGWLSFAGGTAVAYVFLHILPELAAHQKEFSEQLMLGTMSADIWVYALSLLGLTLYYGLERWAKLRRTECVEKGEDGSFVLWTHTASFAFYNLLIGYLLVHREEGGGWSLALYALAIGLHFVTVDHSMRRDHREDYDRISRWVLAVWIFAGWALGLMFMLGDVVIGCLFAFLAGAIVLNVLKEELPEERQSRFWPFIAGVGFYSALLLVERALH